MSKRARSPFDFGHGHEPAEGPKRTFFYDVLGALPTDTSREIRTKWIKAMKASHPDKGGSPRKAGIINNIYETYFKDKTARAVYDENHPLDRQRWEQQEQSVREQIAEDTRLTAIEKEAAERKTKDEKIRKEADAEKERLAKETREREQAKIDARVKAQEKRQKDAAKKQADADATQLEATKLEAEKLQREAMEKEKTEADNEAERLRKKAEVDAAWAAQEAQDRADAEQASRDEADRIKREKDEETARLKAETERIKREADEKEAEALRVAEAETAKKEMVKLRRALGSTEYWRDPTPSRDALQRALDNLEMAFPDLTEDQQATRTKIEEHLEPAEKAEFRELLAKYFELKKVAGIPPPDKQAEKTPKEKKLADILKQLDHKEFWKKGNPGVDFEDALALLAEDPAMAAKYGKELQAKKQAVEALLNLGSFDTQKRFTKLLAEWETTKNTPEDALERFSANKEAMKMQWDLDQILAEDEDNNGSGQYITGMETEAEFRKGIPQSRAEEVMKIANHLKEFYEGAEWLTPAKKAAKLEEEKRAVDEAKKAQNALDEANRQKAVSATEKEARRKKLDDEATERHRQAEDIDAEILAKESAAVADVDAWSAPWLIQTVEQFSQNLGRGFDMDLAVEEREAELQKQLESLPVAEHAKYFKLFKEAIAEAKKTRFADFLDKFLPRQKVKAEEILRLPKDRTSTSVLNKYLGELAGMIEDKLNDIHPDIEEPDRQAYYKKVSDDLGVRVLPPKRETHKNKRHK